MALQVAFSLLSAGHIGSGGHYKEMTGFLTLGGSVKGCGSSFRLPWKELLEREGGEGRAEGREGGREKGGRQGRRVM